MALGFVAAPWLAIPVANVLAAWAIGASISLRMLG